jgi:hypothetical protein
VHSLCVSACDVPRELTCAAVVHACARADGVATVATALRAACTGRGGVGVVGRAGKGWDTSCPWRGRLASADGRRREAVGRGGVYVEHGHLGRGKCGQRWWPRGWVLE